MNQREKERRANNLARTFNRIAESEGHDLSMQALQQLIGLFCLALDVATAGIESDLLDSLRSGYLFGNHDEPLDASGKRIVRVIQQRLEKPPK